MLKKFVLAGLVAVSLVAISASDSHAFFGWRHGCCGTWSGCRGCWGSNSCWGCSGRWGGCRCCSGCWSGCHGCFGCSESWGCSGCYGGCAVSYSYSPQGYFVRSGVVQERIVASSQPSREVIGSESAVKTSLTLHVPADAKVTLAGVSTKQTGETRQFATSKLRAGELWDGYKVVVELVNGDQTLREERIIQLTGGKSQELTINVGSIQVAQR